MTTADLASITLRELNAKLHALPADTNETHWLVANPGGKHAIACGLTLPITVPSSANASLCTRTLAVAVFE